MAKVLEWIRKNIWGVGTLVIVTVISIIAVDFFKKPGQMTVIEANVMDMSAMVPPRGAVPVGIDIATESKIEGTITYTGTVQAFEDEDVYPRITGRIVKMPVYPGDRVTRGQLLVQLDTEESEYKAKLDAAKHLGDAKMHEAGMARKDFEQAKFTLKAAEQAEIAAGQAVNQAQAQYDYWVPEIKRQEALLKDDVVSKEEYDDEYAKFKSAEAKLEESKAKKQQAVNTKLAAKAAFDKAVHHVGHEFSSSLEARAIEKTASIVDRYRDIRASSDGVVTKRLISPGVVVEPGMLILKVAHIEKVRVQAEVSNSDIDRVQLGDKVLISRGIDDPAKPLVGHITSIFPAADKSARTSVVEALVDNLVPKEVGSEKQVRTASQYRFLPGQYVVLNIVTGSRSGVTIPTKAIFNREGKPHVWLASSPGQSRKKTRYKCPMHPSVTSSKPGECSKCGMDLEAVASDEAEKKGTSRNETVYTCTMHPEVESKTPGKCPKCSMDLTPKELPGQKLAELIQIKMGLSNPDRTEVLDGVQAGDEVIYMGFGDLQPSMPVVSVKWTEDGIEKLPLASEVANNRLDKSNGWKLEQMVDHVMLNFSMAPDPPESKKNALVIAISSHGGGAITNATVTAESSMPGMDMKGPALKGEHKGSGKYRMQSDFHSGLWKVDLLIKGASKEPTRLVVDVEVP